MMASIYDRCLRREMSGLPPRYASTKGMYGDRYWATDLDIVDELGGHSGCVNALSWSTSGRLLASGSDDTYMNIHAYQPEDSISPFKLTTTVSTGHSANIFSTKFMPHSNDSTVVTCAGDGEVRVFDIERAAATGSASSVRGARFDNRYKGVRYYTQNNTNGRVYRSHGDRVKRIVTESSPHLFLSCSEDGEVRQFDLRLPSSAYPAPSGSRSFGLSSDSGARVPPPLISYKKYRLDLNTISCSGSQPHYIALGGAHLHCLLHDRRMLGRDLSDERGQPGRASPASELSSNEEEAMGQATRCVRKFAPKGQGSARKPHNPHITACKISDENPNEMIVSWSGDHIYSFNLIRDNTQSKETENVKSSGKPKKNGKNNGDSNHKRKKTDSTTSSEDKEAKRAKARLRRREASSLQIQYENGESEYLDLDDLTTRNPSLPPRPQVWFDSQRRSSLIAKSMTRLRKLMFELDDHTSVSSGTAQRAQTPAKTSFERAHELVNTVLPEMNQICRVWRYPVDPTDEEASLQRTLRANRDAARSFLQAAGTLARFFHMYDSSGVEDEDTMLDQVRSPPNRGPLLLPDHTFSLEFIKAIHLWLQGGRMALLQGFKVIPGQPRTSNFPIPDASGEEGLDDHLIPYLIQSASDRSISNVEVSRFEKDETRKLFNSEAAAVVAFSNAIRMPLEDLSRAVLPANQGPHGSRTLPEAQDRRTATIFWGRKVARGVLLNAGEGLNYEVISIAFGGLGNIDDDEAVGEFREQEDIDADATEEIVESIHINGHVPNGSSSPSESSEHEDEPVVVMEEDVDEDVTDALPGAFVEEQEGHDAEDSEDSEDPDREVDDDNDVDDDDDGDEADDDEDEENGVYSFLSRSSAARGKLHEAVEPNVPCYSHVREYRGHCNVKTVKDCNFFGLQDEYVVSGSDSGHLFIWDKDTGEVVNILEGDSQVVNVVQGHPYEPLLAVSGIDNTIKIFSADARAQEAAQHPEKQQHNPNHPSSSTTAAISNDTTASSAGHIAHNDNRPDPLPSRRRMQDCYSIMSQNDVLRKGGNRDAFITRSMLASLAQQLRERRAGVGGAGGGSEDDGGGGEGGGQPIYLDDNCEVM